MAKAHALENKATIEGNLVRVLYSEPRSRWYDVAAIRAAVPEALITAMGVITTREEVDEKALKNLVKMKKVPESILTTAMKESPLTPRCAIQWRGDK